MEVNDQLAATQHGWGILAKCMHFSKSASPLWEKVHEHLLSHGNVELTAQLPVLNNSLSLVLTKVWKGLECAMRLAPTCVRV